MNQSTVASAANLEAIEALYQSWRQGLEVDPSWRYFFEGFELGLARPAPAAPSDSSQVGIVRLIFAYRDLGHFLAHLDPLSEPRASHPQLELSEFGLGEADLDRVVDTAPFRGGLRHAPLRELLKALRDTYCRNVGVEFMHIQDTDIRRWLKDRMEPNRNRPRFDRAKKLRILKSLHYAELFENFLQTRYTGQKRFSLEGAETLIPILESIVEAAPDQGVREIVLGMAHRGRLNVLANILRKPYEEIFAQFEDKYLPDSMDGDGDVKYHLGFSSDRVNSRGNLVHISLTPNPSHLEAVNPVVEGRCRAKQTLFGDSDRNWGLPVLVHGDAAFAGQGLVAETLNLSQLQGYTTGGTVHIIVNNQIGFTTVPADARSTTYCTDVAKMIQAPIFHVNGEDPEAAVFVTELALEFRQTFKRDVVVDLFCYRRYGHNETDEPSYTQPIMYGKIRGRPTLTQVYTEQLVMTGELSAAQTEEITRKFTDKLQGSLEDVKEGPPEYPLMHGYEGHWKGFARDYTHDPVETGVSEKVLREIADALTRVPEGLAPHPKIAGLFASWKKALDERGSIIWPFAELLSFGSLLLEGTAVRLSGQDSRRGTFSQRHAAVYDARTGERYYPLNAIREGQAELEAYDSLLSEAAVLGFEFGYAMDAPHALVLWEAQFGDFANGAQVIIDQFLASSESKWRRDSGVVMLLPHGYEGQGPEHSSARLERFLQLCAEDNIQVVNPSTPAQYFHLLRRQMHRPFRKPLIVMTPKSLLRGGAAVSPTEELVTGRFHEVIDDARAEPSQIKRVVLCSGKVYYDLLKERDARGARDVALVRVEQFYPLPTELLVGTLTRYRKAKEWVWAQEEPHNNGGWFFVEPRLRALDCDVQYVGRDPSASPATGSGVVHAREQKEIAEAAIAGEVPHLVHAYALAVNGAAAAEKPKTKASAS